MTCHHDPALAKFRHALEAIYGERLVRVVLYGSRARGEGGAGSDYDVAVFLKDMPDRWAELDRLAEVRVRILEDDGPFLDALPYPASAYQDISLPLMREIRKDGVDL